jgi:WD40 repeat protein
MTFRSLIPLLIIVSLLIPTLSNAQYFGQNKVNYRDIEWYYLKTEHFDIYHPRDYYDVAEFTGWEAEEALISIEESWNYTLEGRITIIVYPSHNSFQNNNVSGGSPGESTGGFTEFLKNRVVIPYQGSNSMFRHVIHHELTHAVMLRMLYGEGVQSILTGISRLPLPLWFIEGMAEYESRHGWSNEASMYIRDAIINDYLMPIDYLQGYYIYKGGQSVLYYLEERYGSEKVGELLRKVRSRRNFSTALKDVLGYDLEELSERWHKHLKRQIWPTAAHYEAPEDFAVRVTDHEEWYNFVNTSPALSPEGDRLVMLSDKDDYMSIYLVNTVTGEIEEKVVSGGGGVYLFEQLLWLRPWIDWSPDGRSIAFVAEDGGEDALYTLDVDLGEITGEYKFGLDGIFSPSWSPDGKRILFSGYANGQTDLFAFDLGDESSLKKITDDRFTDYDPDWGPDNKVLFISDRGGNLNPQQSIDNLWDLNYEQLDVYMYDFTTESISRITSDPFDNRSPEFTPRDGIISYVSDATGAYNLYLHDLNKADSWAITDVLTGAFTPSWSNNGSIAFASFYNAGYDVYLYKNPFDESRRKQPSLTYHQQKVRGIISSTEDLGARLSSLTNGSDLHAVQSETPDSVDTIAPRGERVEPGSPEEREIFEALGETPETEAEPEIELAGLDTSFAIQNGTLISDEDLVVINRTDINLILPDTTNILADSAGTLVKAPLDTSYAVADSALHEEKVRLVSGSRSRPAEDVSSSYRSHVFYPSGWSGEKEEDEVALTDAAQDSILGEDGRFIPRKYKLKFSPDIVSAAAGYSAFFGLQGYGQIMISDVLGNHIIFVGTDLYYNFENSNFNLFYYHLPERWDFGGGAFHNVYFFSGGDLRDRNWGLSGTVSYPFSRYKRFDFSFSQINIDRDRWDWERLDYRSDSKMHFILPSIAYIYDNTLWGWTGPLNGSRYRLGFAYSPDLDGEDPQVSKDLWGLDFQTVSLDARKYFHVGLDYSFAFRLAGAASFGEHPQTFFLGGVSNWINRRFEGGYIRDDIEDIYFSGFATPLRGADYYEDFGTRYLLLNNEFRFPLVRQVLFGWPLPFYFSNIRGAIFLDAGAAWSEDFFRFIEDPPDGPATFDDFHMGYGWGFRANLGFFLLKWDMAWKNELDTVSSPRYYVSIGADL